MIRFLKIKTKYFIHSLPFFVYMDMKASKLEINILEQLHLQGFWGKSGNLSVAQRRGYLEGLVKKGLLEVTEKGHEAVMSQRS